MSSYIGSKWRLTRQGKFPAPQYPIIIEPFAGFAGYSQNYHWHQVILVDINPAIISVWKLLQSLDESHYERLPDRFFQVPDHLSPSEQNLLGRWATRGSSTPRKTMSSWVADYPEQFWNPDIKRRLIEQAPFIRHWQLCEGSYLSLPNIEATWFIDAPYQFKPGIYPYCGLPDYRVLREWVLSRRGQVIVCEGGRADWLPFEPLARGRAKVGRPSGETAMNEVWWYRSGL